MNQTSANIDWEQVRRQVAEGDAALRRAIEPDEQRIRAAYRERAARLALPPAGEGSELKTSRQVLCVRLGERQYAVELHYVREAARMPRCTPVPGGPAQLLGVIHHQGDVRSVMDLSRLLNLPSETERDGGFFLLLEDGASQVRVRVDRAEQVQRVNLDQFAPLPATGAAAAAPFVKGVRPDGTVLLCAEALCRHPAVTKREGTR